MIHRSSIVVLALAALVMAGCASTGGGDGGPSYGDPNVITSEELRESGATNAYEAVQMLRSQWLLRDAVAYVDEREYGSPGSLRQISAEDVESIRYHRFAEAIGRFPSFSEGTGVIQVVTR